MTKYRIHLAHPGMETIVGKWLTEEEAKSMIVTNPEFMTIESDGGLLYMPQKEYIANSVLVLEKSDE